MTTNIIFTQDFNKHNNPGHPENAARLNREKERYIEEKEPGYKQAKNYIQEILQN